jgi:UDP-N-acetylmuramoylalanine--D-glutamate ligase
MSMDTGTSTVLILGLGASGGAMARWAARQGWGVRMWDSRAEPPQAAALADELPQAQRLTGPLVPAALDGVVRVLKSPGLAPADAQIAPLLAAAAEQGVPVHGELDLFVRALAALREAEGYAPRVLAITGTNGKTTTAHMTAALLSRAGRRVALAGNVGPTMLDTLAAALDARAAAQAAGVEEVPALPEVWVLELSSFQLAGGGTGADPGVAGFEPAAAALLNLTPDHLDWHGSLAAYGRAKAQVFGTQGVIVAPRGDAAVQALLPPPEPPARGRSKPVKSSTLPRTVMHFGTDAPAAPGDFGIVDEGGIAWLVRALPEEEGVRRKREEPVEIHLQRLMPADALRVRGRHNAANALAALALATAAGTPLAPMLHALREHAGEPHRVQWLGSLGGVQLFDDSKGTNVGATVAALEGLAADVGSGRIVVILGGDGKGQDFAPLAAAVQRHARAVATLGRDAPGIEAAREAALNSADTPLPLQRHPTLEAATAWALSLAREGDALLLSPACASLDMFRSYVHRAEVFVETLRSLAADRGEVLA